MQESLQIIIELSKRLVTIPLNGRSDMDLTNKMCYAKSDTGQFLQSLAMFYRKINNQTK